MKAHIQGALDLLFADAGVEPLEPGHHVLHTSGYFVEFVFHARGEGIVDEIPKVLFQKGHHREGAE
jgi:hypothetical protein